MRGKRELYLVGIAALAAFWRLGWWYGRRMLDGSDEPWGVVALLTVIGLLWREGVKGQPGRSQWIAASALTLLYGVCRSFLPQLVSAGIAVTVLQLSVIPYFASGSMAWLFWGLLLMSLPVMATAQFYLGYPLRLFTGALASGALHTVGIPVERLGVTLQWAGEPVLIDAPCSGLRMLWVGGYLFLVCAYIHRLPLGRLLGLGTVAGMALIVGNAARTVALFFVETTSLSLPHWIHPTVGLSTFLMVGGAIAWLSSRLEVRRCVLGS